MRGKLIAEKLKSDLEMTRTRPLRTHRGRQVMSTNPSKVKL